MRKNPTLRRLIMSFGLMGIAITGFPGCDDSKPATGPESSQAKAASSLARELSPAVDAADEVQLSQDNSAFAFDLMQTLQQPGENLFISPHSVTTALAMSYAGAQGATAEEIARTLHFTLDEEALHPALNKLNLALASRGEGAQGIEGRPFKLQVSNSLWGQADHDFLDTFLDTLALNYGAAMNLVDFIGAPELSREQINAWIAEQTEQLIPELLPPGSLTPMTRLVLTNAVYFNAGWALPFTPEATRDAAFHLSDGSSVDVSMMHLSGYFKTAVSDELIAIELPYADNEISMVILMPAEDQAEAFESALDSERFESTVASLEKTYVDLAMPKFSLRSQSKLSDALKTMGMPLAFTPDADFSGITGTADLFIAEVFHEAFVRVTEEGTEAAAATAVVDVAGSVPPPAIEVTLDRPFFFAIRDRETGCIVFLGWLKHPGT